MRARFGVPGLPARLLVFPALAELLVPGLPCDCRAPGLPPRAALLVPGLPALAELFVPGFPAELFVPGFPRDWAKAGPASRAMVAAVTTLVVRSFFIVQVS